MNQNGCWVKIRPILFGRMGLKPTWLPGATETSWALDLSREPIWVARIEGYAWR